MNKDDYVSNALLEWERNWREGKDVAAEILCREHPEWASELEARITALKATDWLHDLQEELAPTSETEVHRSIRKPSSAFPLPKSSLTAEELARAIWERELLSREEIQHFCESQSEETIQNANRLAEALIAEDKLTPYQATVLLARRSDPLLIDRYVILDVLDSGGMGVVLKALHKSMERMVALKLLPKEVVDSPDKIARFRREVRIAAQLSHPNIVTAYDADESGGLHFLVMELIEGCNLMRLVEENGPVSIAECIDFLIQAAQGLAHAHEKGVVHRDVKPANLLVDEAGRIKVVDVGLAHVMSEENSAGEFLTRTGCVMGTLAFISPEQALDTSSADHRSDIYSLGASAFYLLTGAPPFVESSAMKTLLAHREADIPSIRPVRPEVPESLDRIIRKMLSKRPEERHDSMDLLIEELQACAVELQLTLSERPSPSARYFKPNSNRSRGRRRWQLLVGAIAFGFMVGIVSYLLTRSSSFSPGEGRANGHNSGSNRDGSVSGSDGDPSRMNAVILSTSSPPACLASGPQGRHLYAGLGNGTISSWDLETHRETKLPGSHSQGVTCLAVSPDGRWLASGSRDRILRIVDLQKNKLQATARLPSYVLSLAFTKDSTTVVSSSYHRIAFWEASTGVEIDVWTTKLGRIGTLALSPGRSRLASGAETGKIHLWDISDTGSGDETAVELGSHQEQVNVVTFSPGGKWLASGSTDKTVRLWDVERAEPIAVLKSHRAKVTALAFSPDGKWLSSASEDRSVKLWSLDAKSRKVTLKRTLRHFQKSVSAVAYSADGKTLITTDNSRILLIDIHSLLGSQSD